MLDSKRGLLQFRHSVHLSKGMSCKTPEEIEQMAKVPYASVIRSLMYAMLCTGPDIAHAVSVTSRFQSNPGLEHWIAVKGIFKYLRRTKDLILTYGGGDLQMDGFTDKGTNKYLERKVDILTDALNAIERLKIPLLSPQINELLQNAARELDKLYAEYKKMEEL